MGLCIVELTFTVDVGPDPLRTTRVFVEMPWNSSIISMVFTLGWSFLFLCAGILVLGCDIESAGLELCGGGALSSGSENSP